ncbi:41673_t:CDS:1, partial [Gigaspora margarita]
KPKKLEGLLEPDQQKKVKKELPAIVSNVALYSILADMENQKADITFEQLLKIESTLEPEVSQSVKLVETGMMKKIGKRKCNSINKNNRISQVENENDYMFAIYDYKNKSKEIISIKNEKINKEELYEADVEFSEPFLKSSFYKVEGLEMDKLKVEDTGVRIEDACNNV